MKKGKDSPIYGRHHSEETKKKISLSNKGKIGKSSISKETKKKIVKFYKENISIRKISKKMDVTSSCIYYWLVKLKMAGNSKGKISKETRIKISLGNKGRHHTIKTKIKMSKSGKGKKQSKRHIYNRIKSRQNNNLSWHSEETKIKMRAGHKGALSGENNPNWRGGTSFGYYGLAFNNQLKKQIRKRDNYRCQQCFRHQNELFKNTPIGLKSYKLHVHHIDYNKQNNNPNNLISLCSNCHMQTNYKREDWTNYFQNKIKNVK